MIYPTLTINSDKLFTIDLIDTEFDDNPILSITDTDIEELFIPLLTAFINQYNCGYNDAIDDGMLGEEDICE